MEAFFEVSRLNMYLHIAVTLISITAHLVAARNKQRKELVIELAALYTIGLAGWFSITNGPLGRFCWMQTHWSTKDRGNCFG